MRVIAAPMAAWRERERGSSSKDAIDSIPTCNPCMGRIASQHSLVQLGILYIRKCSSVDAESKLKIERNDSTSSLCCFFNEDVVMGTMARD